MQVDIVFSFINYQGVGKTSILLRYTKDEFATEYHVTVGAEFGSKNINLDGKHRIKLQIWDTVNFFIIAQAEIVNRLDKSLS